MTVEQTRARGLTEAEVAERVAAGKTNDVPDRAGRSVGDIVRANVLTRINAILVVLFALVMTTGEYLDGAFGLLIVANSGIGIVQEVRAKRTLDALTIVGQARPRVRRDGVGREVAPKDVVLDDVIEMGPGDQVVVDGEVIEGGAHLEVDESLLTGEADPVTKHPGDQVLSGSFVVAGSGAYRATRVGADAYAARLAEEASKFTLTKSELRSGIDQILKIITYLLVPAGALIIYNQLNQEDEAFDDALRGMVAALVPMVPEGLVLLTSIAFAVGVVRLGKRQCLVQELPAIEGLARVDVVCADKTGTLTENGMRLSEVRPLEGGTGPYDDVLASLAASDPRPNSSVLALAEAHPHAPGWTESANAPFSSARKWSGSSFERHGDWVLGAPDVLLDPSSPAARAAEEAGSGGLRVLLLGESDRAVDAPGAPGAVTPRALVVLEQRVRDDARATLEYFASQDVEVKVISGDNAVSVGAVAGSLGLAGQAVDARSLSEDPAELAPVLRASTTFGRVSPAQKRSMVTALQQEGHTVAMTGDGVNDVLALKDADIGVAMGAGSPATRAVAQIVLLDNKFATLPYVVAEGRRVIGNIERVSNLFLTKTVYSVFLAIAIGLAQVPYPFIPRHVTFAAWFTTGLPAFVLSFTPNQDRARSGFVGRVLRFAVPAGLTIGVCTFVSYLLVHDGSDATDEQKVQASTTALITLIVIALWVLAIVARPYVWWKLLLIVGSAVAYLVMFTVPFTQDVLELDPSDTGATTSALVIGLIGIVVVEAAWWVDGRLTGEPRVLFGKG